MPLASGLAAQLGFALETVPGTPVTVTSFVPFVEESIQTERTRLESEGIIAGRRLLTSNQWNGGNTTIEGDVGLELMNRGLGKILLAMFGGSAVSGSGPYVHTYTPADLAGDTLTIQIGRPSSDGTVNAFTYGGCKVASWELKCAVGEIATLGLTIVAMNESTVIALATATYPATIKPYKFNHGVVTLAGSSANVFVKSVTLNGDNGLDDDRRSLGSVAIREPLEADLRTYDGTIELEFANLTQHALYVSGAELACVLTFTSGADIMTWTMNIRYDGETPNVDGRGILTQNLPFKAVASGADTTAITVVATNADATD